MTVLFIILLILILFRYWDTSRNANYRYEIETNLLHLRNELYLSKGLISGEYKEEGFRFIESRINSTIEDVNRLSLFFIYSKSKFITLDSGFEEYKEWTEKILNSDLHLRRINDELMRNVTHLVFGSSLIIQSVIQLSRLIIFCRNIFSRKAEKTIFYRIKEQVNQRISIYEQCGFQ